MSQLSISMQQSPPQTVTFKAIYYFSWFCVWGVSVGWLPAPCSLWLAHSGGCIRLGAQQGHSQWPLSTWSPNLTASLSHGSWLFRGRKRKLPVLFKAWPPIWHSVTSVTFFWFKPITRPTHIPGQEKRISPLNGSKGKKTVAIIYPP